ncbi:MAG: PRC-barrel domain-containing protein, partial [Euryarchaeota archaeon]|nr:PRC-barrel domain-containing protein [Euryarchaeota archaeon]
MSIFKKDKKTSEKPPAGKNLYKRDERSEFLEGKSLKKKTKVGFRLGERKEPSQPEKKVVRSYDEARKEIEDVLEDLYPDDKEKIVPPDEYEEKDDDSKKRKPPLKKDMKGKPVYLEDTGEKLGTVFDAIYDKENSLVGYKIKDNKSDAVLSFSIDQFDEDKNGLIFVPSWYMQAVKNIEKFEFKDRISPELTSLLTDDAISNKELYKIFVKYDDEMAKYIEDA